MRDFLISKGFKIGKIDTTLFTKEIGKDLFVCQIYVDDIIFGSTNPVLGRSLVSWSSKKQNSVALSTAEAEYISAGSCCAQLLWMKQTLLDYGVKFDEILLLCDNESAVKIASKIRFNIQEPSILISAIIFLEIM